VATIKLEEVLANEGLAEDQVALLAGMTSSCLEYLSGSSKKLKKDWKIFEDKIKNNVTRKVKKKLADGKSLDDLIKLHPEETDITLELYQNMISMRSSLRIDESLRNVDIKYDNPVSSDTRTGKHAKKADLVFTLVISGDYEIVFEAKSLRDQTSVSAYTGRDGVGCFLNTDSPYTIAPIAGMLGYAYCDSTEVWLSKIKEKHKTTIHSNLLIPAGNSTDSYSIENRKKLKLPKLTLLHKIIDFSRNIDQSEYPLSHFVK